jgi:hypothetical protein
MQDICENLIREVQVCYVTISSAPKSYVPRRFQSVAAIPDPETSPIAKILLTLNAVVMYYRLIEHGSNPAGFSGICRKGHVWRSGFLCDIRHEG